jgi:hypothetical protein
VGQLGRPQNDISRLAFDLCRLPVLQARVEEIKILPARVLSESYLQVLINLRKALETTSIPANIGQQYDTLQRTRSQHPGISVPVDGSVIEGREVRMDRRAKDTSVDVHHQPRSSEELAEDLVETCRMSHRD